MNENPKQGPYGFLFKIPNKNPLFSMDIESLLN